MALKHLFLFILEINGRLVHPLRYVGMVLGDNGRKVRR